MKNQRGALVVKVRVSPGLVSLLETVFSVCNERLSPFMEFIEGHVVEQLEVGGVDLFGAPCLENLEL